jgi:hypothetical protein
MNLSWLTMFIDSGKVGGWARAGVTAGLTALLIKYPVLAPGLDPTTQAAIATAASGIAVGVWSHVAKTVS